MRQSIIGGIVGAILGALAVLGIGAVSDDSKGERAECIVFANQLEEMRYRGAGNGDGNGDESSNDVIRMYNEMCR